MRKFRRVLFLKLARLMRGEKNVVPCIISAGTKIIGHTGGREGWQCCNLNSIFNPWWHRKCLWFIPFIYIDQSTQDKETD